MAAADRDVEAATLARDGPPPITRTTFPTCRAHYPGGSSGCARRLLPHSRGLPQMAGGSASALSLSRPAEASHYGPPDRSAAHRRPLSGGSNPCGYPHKPLVIYRINRQLSGWILPPLMIHAFGALLLAAHSITSSARATGNHVASKQRPPRGRKGEGDRPLLYALEPTKSRRRILAR
jgi:hypothetical protein